MLTVVSSHFTVWSNFCILIACQRVCITFVMFWILYVALHCDCLLASVSNGYQKIFILMAVVLNIWMASETTVISFFSFSKCQFA